MLLLLESIKPPVRTNKQPKEGVKERRRERVNERELVVAVSSCLFICVDKSKNSNCHTKQNLKVSSHNKNSLVVL